MRGHVRISILCRHRRLHLKRFSQYNKIIDPHKIFKIIRICFGRIFMVNSMLIKRGCVFSLYVDQRTLNAKLIRKSIEIKPKNKNQSIANLFRFFLLTLIRTKHQVDHIFRYPFQSFTQQSATKKQLTICDIYLQRCLLQWLLLS